MNSHKMDWVQKFNNLKKQEAECEEFLNNFVKEKAKKAPPVATRAFGTNYLELSLDQDEM